MKETSRILWIDAICIDREDSKEGITERVTQVPLMGEIYGKASRTLCWFREGITYTSAAMQHVETIGRCPSQRDFDKLMSFRG